MSLFEVLLLPPACTTSKLAAAPLAAVAAAPFDVFERCFDIVRACQRASRAASPPFFFRGQNLQRDLAVLSAMDF